MRPFLAPRHPSAQRWKEIDHCDMYHSENVATLLTELVSVTSECGYKGAECEQEYKDLCEADARGA